MEEVVPEILEKVKGERLDLEEEQRKEERRADERKRSTR
jgi:hypothetical protein